MCKQFWVIMLNKSCVDCPHIPCTINPSTADFNETILSFNCCSQSGRSSIVRIVLKMLAQFQNTSESKIVMRPIHSIANKFNSVSLLLIAGSIKVSQIVTTFQSFTSFTPHYFNNALHKINALLKQHFSLRYVSSTKFLYRLNLLNSALNCFISASLFSSWLSRMQLISSALA